MPMIDERPRTALTAIPSSTLTTRLSGPAATVIVRIADIVFALESDSGDIDSYVDRRTGVVHMITLDDTSAINCDEEEIPDWQRETVAAAREIEEGSTEYLKLPTRWEIDGYEMMERFCATRENARTRSTLLEAIEGRGAFRRFREQIRRLDLGTEWERFRVHALTEIAIAWCDENGMTYDRTELPEFPQAGVAAVAAQAHAAGEAERRLVGEPVYTHVTWHARAGHEEEFIEAWNVLGDLFAALENPPVEVTLIRRADEPSLFHSIGSWQSLADAQAVGDNPQAIDAIARLSALCTEGMPAIYEVVRKVRP